MFFVKYVIDKNTSIKVKNRCFSSEESVYNIVIETT